MREILLGLALVCAVGACGPREAEEAPPAAQEAEAPRAITDPAAVVRTIYEPYLEPEGRPASLTEASPWSARLRRELAEMQTRSMEMGEPILDFDPLINAQDWQLGEIAVRADSVVEASHAVVRASFTNAGQREEVIYDLVWEDDRWKVDNVRGAEYDLRAIVTAPPEPPPAP